ncbi:MFS transporter [Streptomyces chattanoogensis]|uniref:MFS transporter n=1 Tax=Streptomyces chattanoogensis TaxID=66876 RepID=UPI00367BF8AB
MLEPPAEPGARSGAMRLYLAAAFSARLAEEGMAVAAVMLAAQRTGSAAQGAFVLTAWMAPHVCAAPLVGAVAGRARRPRLFFSGALAGFAAAIATLAAITGRAPMPVTLAVALVGGGCGPVVSGGLSSLIAGLVPAGVRRDRAYALDASAYSAASVAGPAAVSVVAALASPATATALLGGAAAVAAGLAAALPYGSGPYGAGRPARSAPGQAALRADLVAGLTAVLRTRELGAITAATCLAFLGIGGLTTTTVLLTGHHGRPGSAGVLMTAFAIGALAGSLAVARWRPPLTVHRLAAVALFGTGAALAAAALVPHPPARTALFVAAGLCDGPLLAATLRIRADHAPPSARAQVFTLGAGLKISAASCGAALTGLAAALPPPLLLLGIAALQIAAALLYALLRPRAAGPRGPVSAFTAGKSCPPPGVPEEPSAKITP